MSLLGFDAVGRWALGSLPDDQQTISLTVAAGSFTVTGNPVTFTISEAATAGALVLGGVAASFKISEPVTAGAFAISGKAAAFKVTENISAGTFALNGNPVNEIIIEAEGPAAFVVTGNDAQLARTGPDYDVQQGGIGHYLLERVRAKQLAAITRTIPPPVDRRTAPTFRPVPRPLAAPISPAVDMAAIQKQRMDEAAAAARVAKKRRDEEAILLLAS